MVNTVSKVADASPLRRVRILDERPGLGPRDRETGVLDDDRGGGLTMRRALIPTILLGVGLAVSWAAESAPTFTLPLIQGGRVFDSKAEIGKRILVVRFQASW
jgi:hypothetical protein